ncbi:hypothetical protein F4778DRAFT_346804 [Xylariomycetidae sp. FL2044]|nr:hypothetical protein F4778DRAFT_346804 [Xylariomycetidae sp. FL2044]
MASPERLQAQPAPESTNDDNDHQLLQSLNKLSIATSDSPKFSSTSPIPISNPPFQAASMSSSASPSSRIPPRSPINRSESNSSNFTSPSRSATPSLLRKASTSSLRSLNGVNPARRGSSTLLSPAATRSPLNGSTLRMEEVKPKPAPTPAAVASAYFQRELDLLHATSTDQSADTLVVLHDACYGHRFSRPRTSKGVLSTIVERPERIQASVLGVSMAYVRMGDRHCEGKYPIHPNLDPASLPGIPFRIHKTDRRLPITSTAVTNVHGTKWMDELKIMCDMAESKLALGGSEMRRPEMNRGSDAEPPQKFHEGDLYLCSESLNAFEGALGAVCEAVDAVFSTSSHKRAFVAVRPPGHHCSASYPSGFCWVNNVHVGIMHGILNHGVTHAAIIDFDLHHGDGSQAIAWQHNTRGLTKNAAAWKKTSIGYFSVHDINSYPCEYGDEDKVKNASLCIDNAHGQNIWNVHLHEWKDDVEFWKLYQSRYSILLEKTRNYLRLQTEKFRASGQVPKAAIFLSAGFDASEWEGVGMQRHKVNVPTEFYARLTRDVVKLASEEGLSVDGRVVSVLEGGYSDRALYSGVLSHLGGLAGSEPIAAKEDGSGMNQEMRNSIGSLSRRSTLNENEMKLLLKTPGFPYDPNWWAPSELDRIDAVAVTLPPEAKKPRNITPGNYSSPTQASDAKMTDVAKMRRSVSGVSASRGIISRPPTPPPPDVPWPAAAQALSQLLIPKDRQINSCRHDELNAEATKARRERQSAVAAAQNGASDEIATAAPPRAPTRMSLRERKPAKSLIVADDDDAKSRRKTVGAPTGLAAEKASTRGIPTQNGTKHTRQPSRRLSAASTLTTVAQGPSEPMNVPSRPGSSLTVRPEPSMSFRTQGPPSTLNVKKTRPTAPPRKDSARTSRAPKKTKAAAAKGSTATALASGDVDSKTGVSPKTELSIPSASKVSPTTASDTGNDLENITSGMKKIKINVLTKEQREARQKAAAERQASAVADEKAEPKADEVPSEHPLISVEVPDNMSGIAQVPGINGMVADTSLPKVEIPDSQETVNTQCDYPIEEMKFEMSSPTLPALKTPTEPDSSFFASSSPMQPTPAPASGADLFIQYQPDGPPPDTLPLSGPVKILEPNTGTPARPNRTQLHPPSSNAIPSVPSSPARRGGHAFTANSAIPFAPRPVQETKLMSKENVPSLGISHAKEDVADDGIWEIPETPEHRR